jgi:hypothetical protein
VPADLLEALSDIDELSRRRPEVLGFFSVSGAVAALARAQRGLEGSPSEPSHPAAGLGPVLPCVLRVEQEAAVLRALGAVPSAGG